jgi:hypothetical protein
VEIFKREVGTKGFVPVLVGTRENREMEWIVEEMR